MRGTAGSLAGGRAGRGRAGQVGGWMAGWAGVWRVGLSCRIRLARTPRRPALALPARMRSPPIASAHCTCATSTDGVSHGMKPGLAVIQSQRGRTVEVQQLGGSKHGEENEAQRDENKDQGVGGKRQHARSQGHGGEGTIAPDASDMSWHGCGRPVRAAASPHADPPRACGW